MNGLKKFHLILLTFKIQKIIFGAYLNFKTTVNGLQKTLWSLLYCSLHNFSYTRHAGR
jgi:hypothetical protein